MLQKSLSDLDFGFDLSKIEQFMSNFLQGSNQSLNVFQHSYYLESPESWFYLPPGLPYYR